MTRRDVLAGMSAPLLGSAFGAQAAQHAHNVVAGEKKASGVYKPKLFTPGEYAALRRLAELIIPADETSKSAADAGAPEFIDLLASNNPELAAIYTGGLGWLDREMVKRHGQPFVKATPEQQTAMLDLIAYSRNITAELAPGIVFFDWARKMVVDGYYTSPIGVRAIGYMGNRGMAVFQVPEAAITYAVKKSGLE
ncbi:MAG TPA: gluconate 2-dehydrogenase subunit 3 family protein [Bryobacteraceae bacterium]|nr:gluconate 2-dehydrogenase subunit 3 family protein [Bryobacteraceae bacterium]